MRAPASSGFRKGKAVNALFHLNTVGERFSPVCEDCGKAIPDARILSRGPDTSFCSRRCAQRSKNKSNGRFHGTGRIGRLKPYYDAAVQAKGEWIDIHASSPSDANSIFTAALNNSGGFDAKRDGLTVSIRKVTA